MGGRGEVLKHMVSTNEALGYLLTNTGHGNMEILIEICCLIVDFHTSSYFITFIQTSVYYFGHECVKSSVCEAVYD